MAEKNEGSIEGNDPTKESMEKEIGLTLEHLGFEDHDWIRITGQNPEAFVYNLCELYSEFQAKHTGKEVEDLKEKSQKTTVVTSALDSIYKGAELKVEGKGKKLENTDKIDFGIRIAQKISNLDEIKKSVKAFNVKAVLPIVLAVELEPRYQSKGVKNTYELEFAIILAESKSSGKLHVRVKASKKSIKNAQSRAEQGEAEILLSSLLSNRPTRLTWRIATKKIRRDGLDWPKTEK